MRKSRAQSVRKTPDGHACAHPDIPAVMEAAHDIETAYGLTSRAASFVIEYLVDRNATQAAIRAGYSEKSAQQQVQSTVVKCDGNDSGPSNGYQKLPSGLIIQWGYEAGVNSNGAGYTSFTHYIQYPFPNNMLFVMGNMYSPGNTGWDNLKLWPKDKNSFYVKRHTSLSNPFDYAYLCIGY